MKDQNRTNARAVALDVLMRVHKDAAFSPLALQAELSQSPMNPADRGLTTELVYGTLQWQGWLDEQLKPLAVKGLHKLEPWVLILLRLSIYQLAVLDKIPAHAAVNEAVSIARKRGHEGISKLVNGMLRAWLRQPSSSVKADEQTAALAAHPSWMVKRWSEQWGNDTAMAIAASNLLRPAVSVRVNTLLITRNELKLQLEEAGYLVSESVLSPDGLVLNGGMPVQFSKWFREGMLTLQDESSMLVAEAAAPAEGATVLDACAAPGGKTTHLVQKMRGTGEVWALDQHAHKEQLIQENAARLRMGKSIRTKVTDAREAKTLFSPASFDLVLLDAPCSGSGVLRRKPERKWQPEADAVRGLKALQALQSELLDELAPLVKKGGTFIYSTCAIERDENDKQIQAFLQRHPEFTLDPQLQHMLEGASDRFDWQQAGSTRGLLPGMVQILPHDAETDGFFIARMKRL